MRPILSLKTLYRAPFKTLLTFALIAAATFAVFSRVTDYFVTRREFSRAVSFYRGVAAFDTGVPNTAFFTFSQLPNTRKYSYYKNQEAPPPSLTAEQIDAFSALPGVTSVDARYMTAGVIGGLSRVTNYGQYITRYTYPNRFIIEGTYVGYEKDEVWTNTDTNLLVVTDWKMLAGDAPLVAGGDVIIRTNARDGGDIYYGYDFTSGFALVDNPFGQSFADSLTEGGRCLLIGRWRDGGRLRVVGPIFDLGDQDTIDYIDSFIPLDGKPENWLETEEFADVRELIDITNRDLITFDMVYTSDMLSIPRFNEGKMAIQEGRALTADDTDACVINYSLMELNGLKIGDKITAELCDTLLTQHAGMGAAAVIPERYGNIVKTAELTIVGAYTDTDAQYERDAAEWWGYSPNTIFVPRSLLPVEVPAAHGLKSGEFSVASDDAYMLREFRGSAEALAKEYGVKLRFSDGGGIAALENINTSQTMSLITTVTYIAASLAALFLTVYLYISRQKKTYAVMRAMGTPRKKARNSVVLPFAALALSAIPIGAAAGLIYASSAISEAVMELQSAVSAEYTPDTSLPVFVIFMCLLCEAGFLLSISALFMKKLADTPVLALLAGDAPTKKRRKNATANINSNFNPNSETEPVPVFSLAPLTNLPTPERGKYNAAKHVTAYILRHMRRAAKKSAITVILAVLLTSACGLLAVTKLSYQELFNATDVTGHMLNYPSSAIYQAQKSELMENFYYSGGFTVIINGIPKDYSYSFAVTNDIDRYIQSKTEEKYLVRYAEGADSSLFKGNEAVCLVGSKLASAYGIKAGDTITMLSWDKMQILSVLYQDKNEFYSAILRDSTEFYVAGTIIAEENSVAMAIYAPASEAVRRMSVYGEYAYPVELSEFNMADKENPQTLTRYLEELAAEDIKYTGEVFYNMNLTQLNNIKRVRDMLVTLFPIAIAAAVLIGAAAGALVVINQAKEAACLRILGTTKLRARCMLALEQIGLCVFGIILTSAGLLVYNAGLFARGALTLLWCAGLYLCGCAIASAVAATEITKRKALELLQVKE